MRSFNGLAFCSPLHARAPANLQGRALAAMRPVGLDSGTLDGAYHCAHTALAHRGRCACGGPSARGPALYRLG